jgi:murein DD-endopeptidase
MRRALLVALALSLAACSFHRHEESPETQAIRRAIVLEALGQIGRPYVYGGRTPDGFDCSGLVQYVYAQAGVAVPRSTRELLDAAERIDLDEAQPGDLLFYRFGWFGIDHVAVYLGDGEAVHAPASGRTVIVAPVGNQWWMDRFVEAARLLN